MTIEEPPDSLDQLIGRNIRFYRTNSGLSQTALGASVGVTFQQIQKYEKAANRIPASRLIQIARALGVPVRALWGGDAEATGSAVASQPPASAMRAYRRRLKRAASNITDPQLLKLAAELVEGIAKLTAP
jgi:transcriptional regulator with XRE-family HTH domain